MSAWVGGTLSRRFFSVVVFSLLTLLLADSGFAVRTRPRQVEKPRGVTHVVEQGQTLFRIAQAYDIKIAALTDANRVKASSPLRVGQKIFVPGARSIKKVEASRPLSKEERVQLEDSLKEEVVPPPPPAAPAAPNPPLRVRTDAELVWPLLGPINSPFGPRWGRFHAGLDIGSPHYQEVVAAADGEVIYANNTKGALGKAVVIQHVQGTRTVYAHLSVIAAHEGESVRQGQPIGGVGDTGRTTGPHLHFEVRRNGTPINPEQCLPGTIDDLVHALSASR
jgi:murein DD-endopeptidase MepM/ murein hydrolase activator NlpD